MSLRWLAMALLVFIGLSQPAASQTGRAEPAASQAAADEASRELELKTAFAEGAKAATKGKADVPLLAQASLHLPSNYMFIPQPQAARIMRALGNTASKSLVGLVFPASGTQDWFAEIKFIESGYVKDDEAKDWKAGALLASLREGTEEANKDRIARGFAAIEVVGWAQPPIYDLKSHRLVWAATNRELNSADTTLGVNYNTYALGREGYFTLNLLTDADKLSNNKVHSVTLLAALEYNKGKAYTDFDSSTDNVAAYGITALVAGVAAKKLGMFALIAAFAAKGGKILIIAGIAALAGAEAAVHRAQNPDGLNGPGRRNGDYRTRACCNPGAPRARSSPESVPIFLVTMLSSRVKHLKRITEAAARPAALEVRDGNVAWPLCMRSGGNHQKDNEVVAGVEMPAGNDEGRAGLLLGLIRKRERHHNHIERVINCHRPWRLPACPIRSASSSICARCVTSIAAAFVRMIRLSSISYFTKSPGLSRKRSRTRLGMVVCDFEVRRLCIVTLLTSLQ